jgi:PAS domain S-box-containing protein
MLQRLTAFDSGKRIQNLAIALVLIVAIVLVDWKTNTYISIGFLYLFPILIAARVLNRWQIVLLGFGCALLHEAFSRLPPNEAVARSAMVTIAFAGTGLFASELTRNRQRALTHIEEMSEQIRFRRDAEKRLELLIESNPAAILSVDRSGKILIANHAAHQLLSSGGEPLVGTLIGRYLPALQVAAERNLSQTFRTSMQCRARSANGESFFAGVWFSTYETLSGSILSAIIVDVSDDFREREELNLNQVLKNSRVLIAAMAHEMQNLCGAISVVHKNLSKLAVLEQEQDFLALGSLVRALEKLAALELVSSREDQVDAVDLASVLDELRVLMNPALTEGGVALEIESPAGLPDVSADRYSLLQVFINLTRNGLRALQNSLVRELHISASADGEAIVRIRFRDTGPGVPAPEALFRPFHAGADMNGIGLYVSRAILRSFGGNLLYEPSETGCCFAVVLAAASVRETTA